jgi:indolepyruvate ferredoxin oxidoreductase beta subunit
MANNDVFNLIVAGVGGQGSILASHIIAEAAVKSGLKVRVGETFGAAQRGGKVHSNVRLGEGVYGPLCPEGSLDVLIGLEPNETLRLAVKYASPRTLVITNTRPVPSMDVNIGAERYPDVEDIVEGLEEISGGVVAFDATMLALEAGNERTMNVVLLGALAATKKLPFDEEYLKEAIRERVPPKTIETNNIAYDKGYKISQVKINGNEHE